MTAQPEFAGHHGVANGATPVLSVDSITAGYGAATVLRDVSFMVRRGEIVALLGSNGAGKTTTLRTVAGLLKPSAGTCHLHGTDVTSWSASRRVGQGLCLIPEGRGIFRRLSVRENLRLQRGPRRATARPVDDALELFPALAPRQGDLAGLLSGGQQQMLALARAYLTSPSIILLDEVSMGLAPKIVDQIFEVLAEIARAGVAMVLVEQYVTRAMNMANKVVMLRRGSIVFDGATSDLDEEQVVQSYLGGV
jgi:branched-chain amino acid transport system ATP-binding protein